jgi:predicted transcriptional regulator of viral defense system
MHIATIMSDSPRRRILQLADKQAFVRPRDVERMGIAREYLLRLYRQGELIRTARGMYRRPDATITEQHTFAEVAKRVPEATLCLLSALAFHKLTTQNPFDVWIALPRGLRTPLLETVSLRVHRFSAAAFTAGREKHLVEGVPVHVYNPAKTVADCFKYRNKIGLDVALEALRASLRERRATVRQIDHYAKICRVSKVIRPYLEAI